VQGRPAAPTVGSRHRTMVKNARSKAGPTPARSPDIGTTCVATFPYVRKQNRHTCQHAKISGSYMVCKAFVQTTLQNKLEQ
jgi:hypothetical protein